MGASLLLASNSPRRRTLLTDAGFDFVTVTPRLAERFSGHLTLGELTAFNAIRKALSVARNYPDRIVLAADTLVALKDEIIGKPRDRGEAVAILRRLSGRAHEVCSSVFICHLARAKSASFREVSRVSFRRLNDEAILDYLETVDPFDKAGAYAAQGESAEIIEKIEGSYTNVVGLPMEKTIATLAEFGVKPKHKSQPGIGP
jgi:nucleoside triphosphate pyrophosphatase